MSGEKIYLGRQPILDNTSNIVGFEILVRSKDRGQTSIKDITQSSAGAIVNTLSDFGLGEVVGKRHKAFFNVNAEILMSDMIELLPKEQVVIELLESIDIESTLLQRCKSLKEMGFSLALCGSESISAPLPLLESIDIVKVNIEGASNGALTQALAPLRGLPLKLLAAKVEDIAQHEYTKKLGFDFFQGYYFAKPVILSGNRLNLENVVVMKLVNQMLRGDGLSEIEKTFRESPSLSYNLLTLVNSVSIGTREKINSVRHAIVLLGRDRLNRWAQVLMFSNGDKLEHRNPLLNTAVMRGRFMELLVESGAIGGDKPTADHAFMTGILSLIDSLMKKPMAEIVEQMGLADAVTAALLDREGDLGQILSLIEGLEKSDTAVVSALSQQCNIGMEQLYEAEQEATKWTKNLTDSF